MSTVGMRPRPALPFSKKEGWKHWVYTDKVVPEMPSKEEWEAMSEGARRRFDIRRKRHHDFFGVIETEPIKPIVETIVERAENNTGEVSGARPGIVIDGKPTVGKTMTTAYAGRIYEREQYKLFQPELEEHGVAEWIPVVYHTLDVPATVKNLNLGLLDFYGAGVSSRDGTAKLTDKVEWHVQRCETSLIIIDDLHYLDMSRDDDRKVNDHLKMLMNETSVTFVCAGVNLLETNLFFTEGCPVHPGDEEHLSQTGRRFSSFSMEPYRLATKEERKTWALLLNAIEDNLCLRNLEKGTLVAMGGYLYARTEGFIGPLRLLIRDGANKAIKNGMETITRELLDEIKLAYAVEKAYKSKTRGRWE